MNEDLNVHVMIRWNNQCKMQILQIFELDDVKHVIKNMLQKQDNKS